MRRAASAMLIISAVFLSGCGYFFSGEPSPTPEPAVEATPSPMPTPGAVNPVFAFYDDFFAFSEPVTADLRHAAADNGEALRLTLEAEEMLCLAALPRLTVGAMYSIDDDGVVTGSSESVLTGSGSMRLDDSGDYVFSYDFADETRLDGELTPKGLTFVYNGAEYGILFRDNGYAVYAAHGERGQLLIIEADGARYMADTEKTALSAIPEDAVFDMVYSPNELTVN